MELIQHPQVMPDNQTSRITKREEQILSLMAKGYMHKEIATSLEISLGTVIRHVKNIYLKIDVHNKIEALNKTRSLFLPI